MSTLFISHSSRNNDIARDLQARLADQHHSSIFLDIDPEKGIQAGQSWEKTLYRKLRACQGVIAICTADYLASKWCFAEVALARMEGKHIIALIYDESVRTSSLPSILSDRQIIKMAADPETSYQRLWNGLKDLQLLGVQGDWDPSQPPYLGLASYKEKDAAVFFGRNDETRIGVEMVSRGAPNLVMVVGASGSGKSSLVMAGILPRLRRLRDQWIVVDPFRPGRNPFRELAVSLERAFKKTVPPEKAKTFSATYLAAELSKEAKSTVPAASDSSKASDHPETVDDRLKRLLDQIEELRQNPPDRTGGRLDHFLEWSVEDLRRICGEDPETTPQQASGTTTSLNAICNQLRRLSKDQRHARVLIVVDQFEELLGLDEESPSQRFLKLLRTSLDAGAQAPMVLGSMRSDYLGTFQRNKALRGIDFETLSLGPMRHEHLREIIEKPAQLAALTLEDGLTDRLMADTGTSDALPLLSFTLWKMWRDYSDDGLLEIREYDQLGGLQGAISSEADTLLKSARKDGNADALRRAFLQMARLSEDGTYARKPASLSHPDLAAIEDLLMKFVDRRLLFTYADGDDKIVEVSHESLFRSWPPLKRWLDDNRSELLFLRQVERDAKVWEDRGRQVEDLWTGGKVERAGELASGISLGEIEQDFVDEGIREKRKRFRRKRNIYLSIGAGLLGLVAFATWAAFTALFQSWKVDDQLALSHWREARVARDDGDYLKSLHLAAEAIDQGKMKKLESITHQVASNWGWFKSNLVRKNIAFDFRETLNRIYPLMFLSHDTGINFATFYADGTHILTCGKDSLLGMREVDTGKSKQYNLKHNGAVEGALFNRDETMLLSWGTDHMARLWDMSTGEQMVPPMNHQVQENITGGYSDFIKRGPVFNGDESQILTWTDSSIWLWDIATCSSIDLAFNHDHDIIGALFVGDGQRILSWDGKEAQLWDAMNGGKVGFVMKHNSEFLPPVLNQEESLILTWDRHELSIWDALSGEQVGVDIHVDIDLLGAIFNQDNTQILSWGKGGVNLYNLTNDSRTSYGSENDTIAWAEFDAGETSILGSGWSGYKLWVQKTGGLLASHSNEKDEMMRAEFSQDGNRILSWTKTGKPYLWDVLEKKQVDFFAIPGSYHGGGVTWQEDLILTWDSYGNARLWPVNIEEQLDLIQKNKEMKGGSSKRSGKLSTYSDGHSELSIYENKSDELAGPPIRYDQMFLAAALNNDQTLVTTRTDSFHQIQIWDVSTGWQVGRTFNNDLPIDSIMFDINDTGVLSWDADKIRYRIIPLDRDFPLEHYKLQLQAITKSRLNTSDYTIERIPDTELQKLKDEWLHEASSHYQECNYHQNNMYRMYLLTL